MLIRPDQIISPRPGVVAPVQQAFGVDHFASATLGPGHHHCGNGNPGRSRVLQERRRWGATIEIDASEAAP